MVFYENTISLVHKKYVMNFLFLDHILNVSYGKGGSVRERETDDGQILIPKRNLSASYCVSEDSL